MTTSFDTVIEKFPFTIKETELAQQLEAIARKEKENEKNETYQKLLNCLDLTSLDAADNDNSIMTLVKRVNDFGNNQPGIDNVAGICVYPCFCEIVKSTLEEEKVKIVAVTGGFPHGQALSEVKVAETALAVADGAEEIDTVLNRGLLVAKDYETLIDDLVEVKNACRGKTLKVILETGGLPDAESIWKASLLAIYSGADFIKTSTGKNGYATTPEAVYIMCKAIKAYNEAFNLKIGIKIAGGIASTQEAVKYYTIVKEVLGEEWLNPALFRIGASRLANQLVTSIFGRRKNY